MTGLDVILAPHLPVPVLVGLAALAGLATLGALWRGLGGWALRGLGLGLLILALAGPMLRRELSEPLSDIVVLVTDESASQNLADRAEVTARTAARLQAALAGLPGVELRRVTLGDAPENGGTRMGAALAGALAREPSARIAGVIALSDGAVHDPESLPALPAPFHVLLTGHRGEWDRRLVLREAPAFGIIGEELVIGLRIEDLGDVPASVTGRARIDISVDGAPPESFEVPVGRDLELPLTLEHGGQNVVQISLPEAAGEITPRNNAAVVQINGVRDRLRVLLVSGEPHAGERTWRNLLKSDASVDLVHFTILRPPEKQDGVPVSQLALIAFPTRELFLEKIDEFDLIIFDRYRARGLLPDTYYDSIRAYVEAGGAILVAAGPEFAGVESLSHTPLGAVLPAGPSGRVEETPFRPRVTELGARHPVTAGLMPDPAAEADWGRWLRRIDLGPVDGQVVMRAGADGGPLLVLSRVGKGRVALLASDQAWLWDRGFEGGGPQQELLRRIAHWSMQEPDLEEESLEARVRPGKLEARILRRTLSEETPDLTITTPAGAVLTPELRPDGPGRFVLDWTAPEPGLYRLRSGEIARVLGLGPAAPREYEMPLATQGPLAAAVAGSGGAFRRLEDGVPQIRLVRPGAQAAGRGWIGITPRDARAVTGMEVRPLLPEWAWAVLVALAFVAAWLLEGRRRLSRRASAP
ncbi:glutamine amidotransferase [Phaeovulum vinaykumarii]|uniref:Uncharacterized membrane protein n=1 Tax=Phaeovulum vinaykumarii TaxID=407234 RepID=A0A1N7KRS7_9RHOB|nr:glutamine amidotransferase [Phaeovulum vinaykumarii]SIS64274.1 Uncharacterized membrane protein [Phaeovulum vinaykumarii]SOC01626.1 uncharacterized membrane protein [Phaeovulum vinaykumarii]